MQCILEAGKKLEEASSAELLGRRRSRKRKYAVLEKVGYGERKRVHGPDKAMNDKLEQREKAGGEAAIILLGRSAPRRAHGGGKGT